ncbi:hypothetical protein Tco_1380826, partial [Tanacetum coccineum]
MSVKGLPSIVNAPTSRLLGAYDLGVATLRAVVHAGDKTSGDARSWVFGLYIGIATTDGYSVYEDLSQQDVDGNRNSRFGDSV